METEFQDLNWAIPIIQKKYSKNPNSSISAIFRYLRRKPHLSLFGDYPLLSIVLKTILEIGIKPKRNQVLYALNQSEELYQLSKKDKNNLLDQLLKTPPVETKKHKNLIRLTKK